MTSTPITSEPVIVSAEDIAVTATLDCSQPENQTQTLESRIEKLEKLLEAQNAANQPTGREGSRSRSRSRSRVIIHRSRYRSVSPSEEPAVITSSTSLLNLINKDTSITDGLSEVRSTPGRLGTHLVYITTLPTHQAELDKTSWIFRLGIEDAWVQKPVNFLGRDQWNYNLASVTGNGRRRSRVNYVEDDYDDQRFDRGQMPIVKLGTLFTKIFPGDESGDGETGVAKVKFLTVVQGKPSPGWAKLIVSHTRAAALTDIFYELVNGFSVLFVGAVLRDVAVPFIAPGHGGSGGNDLVFEKVNNVEEAENVGSGRTGIIC